ncbi:metal-dependent hydrolase [Actinomadura barringtoniae]|uniref:Metal-dependent hydrolase n=1 Tax=Actinomadura barringtoniae TaxID=1427535 RepID=A0A939PRR6_9ACTN|nr:metal-dependent hydrolase [Actinomadura barringtoniae]MBO2453556.1 metal-dependent hydrolase [Actinomadura barringtoniae]
MSSNALPKPRPSIRPRTVRTRRIAFEYPPERLPRHYIGGDLVMSHIVSVLSSLFPEGEDFFVRTVRNYRDRIDDPELKSQVAGFIGQEVTHGREHRQFNDRLATMGYPTRIIDRLTKYGLGLDEKILPKQVQLAITAALEHYTATLAEVLMSDPEARAMFDVDEVRSMFLWHALEESEHKSVAFDVYRHIGGNEFRRAMVMRFTSLGLVGAIVAGTFLSLLLDRSAYNPARLFPSVGRLRHSPWLRREVLRRLRDYNRRDFHPDDNDATELLAEWKVKLFGAEGALADRMKSPEPDVPGASTAKGREALG